MGVELYILRHGETEWNAAGRLQGDLDSALTERGRAQADRQARILTRLDLHRFDLLCSPQGRARATARIALRGHVARDLPDLREIGIGDWAGRLRAEVLTPGALSDDPFALYDLAPNGEGLAGLAGRCEKLLAGLSAPSVLITHGITSRMIRALVLGQGPAGLRDVGGGQGVVYHLKDGVQKRLD